MSPAAISTGDAAAAGVATAGGPAATPVSGALRRGPCPRPDDLRAVAVGRLLFRFAGRRDLGHRKGVVLATDRFVGGSGCRTAGRGLTLDRGVGLLVVLVVGHRILACPRAVRLFVWQ